ncbi:precorrin-3B synthase [Hoyosella rhizosphaerae]|nr:precorrin-3B synthase [Hoyosella rhizosphaerae]MBN4926716.1 precorrin-3B synthase [Hoyosella rhizosphaerae]
MADDRCPGAFRLHEAADGLLARVRLPGGMLTPAQVHTLAEVARNHSNGVLELTSRANIQLRGIPDADAADAVVEQLTTAGLLPSRTHERVRNILASPLSGVMGGFVDVRPWVTRFDELLCSQPELAALSGRFLVGFDDGRGDIAGLDADITAMAFDETTVALLVGGSDTGIRVPVDDVVPLVLEAALAFAAVRTGEWRVNDLPERGREITASLSVAPTHGAEDVYVPERTVPPVGWFASDDGGVALGAATRLGRIDVRLAEFLAAIEQPVVVTPWRTLVVTGLDEWRAEQVVRVLAPMGLIFDADSPWVSVSACTGRPGCGRAVADVHADVTQAVTEDSLPVQGRQHWVGCERQCGTPAGEVHVVTATTSGYRTART